MRPIILLLVNRPTADGLAQVIKVFTCFGRPTSHERLMSMTVVAPSREFLQYAPTVTHKARRLLCRKLRPRRRTLRNQAEHALVTDDRIHATSPEKRINFSNLPRVRIGRMLHEEVPAFRHLQLEQLEAEQYVLGRLLPQPGTAFPIRDRALQYSMPGDERRAYKVDSR